MVFFQPVHRVGNQEALDLGLAVVKDPGGPVGMLVAFGIAQLIGAGAVEFVKPVLVLGEMGRHPVQNHADARLMQRVHQLHQLLRRAVAGGGGVVVGHLIAPAGVEGVLRQRHEFHMGIAHVFQVFRQNRGNFRVGVHRAVLLAPPGAEVHFVNVHRAVQRGPGGAALEPLGVVPAVGALVADDAGGVRRPAGPEAHRVGLVDRAAVPMADQKFIRAALLRIGGPGLPHALGDFLHGQILRIPEVKITDDGNRLGIGRPDPENVAGNVAAAFRVAAQEIKGADLGAVVVSL